MKLNLALVTSTAITLAFAGHAVADDSLAIIMQNGDANIAEVSQEVGNGHQTFLTQISPTWSNGNRAYITQKNVNSPYFNTALGNVLGSAGDAALQNGQNNILVLTQDYAGSNGNQVGTAGWGFEQRGIGNSATITQLGARNYAGEVWQNATHGARNVLTLNQGTGPVGEYAFNLVNSIKQDSNSWADNTAHIVQSGGTSNLIEAFVQNGGGNWARVTQSGERNALALVKQDGISNYADISVTGNFNGSNGSFNGSTSHNSAVLVGFSGAVQAATSLSQGAIVQDGQQNHLSVNVLGDENLMAFSQNGNGNWITGDIVGNGNQVAALQHGNSNWLNFSQMGNGNGIAVNQTGNGNSTTITQ